MLGNAPVLTTIPVVDLERAKAFYGQTLGLNPVRMPNRDTNGIGALFEAGDGTLLALYPRPTPANADHTLASFWVEDLEAAIKELAARGINFEQYDLPGIKTDERGIAQADSMKGAWFKDPEGNILGLGELL
jgi:predicted enzyme related to lactoylglutathione lyase